jgi:hypothetical protein
VNLTWIKNQHTVKWAPSTTTSTPTSSSASTSSVPSTSAAPTRPPARHLGTGGTIANRFDANTATYPLQLGNLLAATRPMSSRVRAGQLEGPSRTLTVNAGLRWEGAFNPTPDATTPRMLNR